MATRELCEKVILKFAHTATRLLKEHYTDNLASVCLFGSVARGTFRRGSDVDFLIIIKDAQRSYHKRVKDVIPLLDIMRETNEYEQMELLNLNLEPSFLILTTDEIKSHPPVLLDISQEGIILLDTEKFLERHLNMIRETLKKLGSVKKITPHGYYWVLKPDIKSGEVVSI